MLILAAIGATVILAESEALSFVRYSLGTLCAWWRGRVHEYFSEHTDGAPEWCLYCTGFWVGLTFGLCETGWLGHPLLDGLMMAGVLWPLAELRQFAAGLWLSREVTDGRVSTTAGNDDCA